MEKGVRPFSILAEGTMTKTTKQSAQQNLEPARPAPTTPRRETIAHRRACDAQGTGLTHFILVDEKKQK